MKALRWILPLLVIASCSKTIDKDIVSGDVSLLEIRIKGQLGNALIERDYDESRATVYVMEKADFPYSAVPVEGIVVSSGASSSISSGQTLNFSNPERRAKVVVTAANGNKMDWWIYLKAYDAFYVGEWAIVDIKLHCNQRVSGSGEGVWDTSLKGAEFGGNCNAEFDNHIIITMDDEPENNMLTGTITNTPGLDEEYGHFWGVGAPYSIESPLDMDPRLRHLLPPGEAKWKLELSTGQMKITKDNVTSTMIFGTDQWDNTLFRFPLPDAGKEPSRDGFYDNMWRSSTELFYAMKKLK